MYVVKFDHVDHLVYTPYNPIVLEGPKDSNNLETSRDNCVVVRDLKNTANQGAQFYMLQQNSHMICLSVLKGVFRNA